MKKISIVLILVSVLAGLAVAAIPSSDVYATAIDNEAPPVEQMGFGKQPLKKQSMKPFGEEVKPIGLEGAYKNLIKRFEQMGLKLERADTVVERLEEQIVKLQDEGKDTADLEAALNEFVTNAAAAQAVYDEAAELIDEHIGFNFKGEVEDEGLAIQTLRDISGKLLDVHQLMEDAKYELRWDLMEYRYKNRPVDEP